MLNYIRIALVLLGLRVVVKSHSLAVYLVYQVPPVIALSGNRSGKVGSVWVVEALGQQYALVDLRFSDGVGEAKDLFEVKVALAEL